MMREMQNPNAGTVATARNTDRRFASSVAVALLSQAGHLRARARQLDRAGAFDAAQACRDEADELQREARDL